MAPGRGVGRRGPFIDLVRVKAEPCQNLPEVAQPPLLIGDESPMNRWADHKPPRDPCVGGVGPVEDPQALQQELPGAVLEEVKEDVSILDHSKLCDVEGGAQGVDGGEVVGQVGMAEGETRGIDPEGVWVVQLDLDHLDAFQVHCAGPVECSPIKLVLPPGMTRHDGHIGHGGQVVMGQAAYLGVHGSCGGKDQDNSVIRVVKTRD